MNSAFVLLLTKSKLIHQYKYKYKDRKKLNCNFFILFFIVYYIFFWKNSCESKKIVKIALLNYF